MGLSVADRRGKLVLIATILGSGMTFLDLTVVNVALRDIGDDLGASLTGLQWVVNAYALTLASLILLGGSLGDVTGRRRVFVIGLAGFASTSLVCAIAPTTPLLVGARALQGIAGALLAPGSLSIIAATFDPAERGRAIGLWSGFAGVTTAFGPFLGGLLVDAGSWRWVFVLNLPLAVVAVWVAVSNIPESRDPNPRRPDVVGSILAIAGLAGVIYALIEAGGRGFDDATVVTFGSTGAVLLVAFVLFERRARDPMLPLSLFSSAQFTGANLATLAVYAALGGTLFLTLLHLRTHLDYGGTAAGVSLLPITVLILLFSPRAGRLADRIGPRLPMTIGPIVLAVGMVLMSRIRPGDTYWSAVFPAAVAAGAGLATTVAPLTAAVLAAVDERHTGITSAVNNTVARAAGLLAISVLPIAVGASGAAQEALSVSQYGHAMLIAGAVAAAGGVIAFATVRPQSAIKRRAVSVMEPPNEG